MRIAHNLQTVILVNVVENSYKLIHITNKKLYLHVVIKYLLNQITHNYWFAWSVGMVLMISESPGSVIDNVATLKYLPHAVPNSMLLPEYWKTSVLDNIA